MRKIKPIVLLLTLALVLYPLSVVTAEEAETDGAESGETDWWNKEDTLVTAEKTKIDSRWNQERREEFKVGSLAGLAGGAGGALLAGLLSYEYYSRQDGSSGYSFGAEGLALAFAAGVGYPVGSSLGAGTGVWLKGKQLGESDNPAGAYLGAGIASGLGFWGTTLLSNSLYHQQNFFYSHPLGTFFLRTVSFVTSVIALATPAVASLGATFGYNFGDIVDDDN